MTELLLRKRKLTLTGAIIPIVACVCIALAQYLWGDAGWQMILIISSLPLLFWLVISETERLYYLLMLLVPLSVPFKFDGGAVMGFPSEGLLALLGIYLLMSGTLKPIVPLKIFMHPIVLMLLIEVGWMLFCGIVCADPLVSLKRIFMRLLFIQLYLIYGVHLFLKKGVRYHWLFLLYAVGLIYPVIHSFLFHLKFNFASTAAYRMCGPFYADHTIYGACIAFVLPMMLVLMLGNLRIGMNRALYVFVIVLGLFLIAAEVLSFSRAGWISLFVSAIFGIFLLFRVKLISILLLLAIAGGVIAFYSDEIYTKISTNDAISNKGDISDHLMSVTNVQSDASNTERINRWICAWKMAMDKPITGWGPGMYQFEYGRYQERLFMTRISTFRGNRGHAHSEYFTQLSETGFPGAILFIIIVFSVIGYGMKVIYAETDKRTKLLLYGVVLGLISFYVHGVFNAFLDTDKMAILVFGSIAAIVAADLRQKADADKKAPVVPGSL